MIVGSLVGVEAYSNVVYRHTILKLWIGILVKELLESSKITHGKLLAKIDQHICAGFGKVIVLHGFAQPFLPTLKKNYIDVY